MSKMGQYVIELTEKRIARYYGYSDRNGRTTAEAKPTSTESTADRSIAGAEFFSGDTGGGCRSEAQVDRGTTPEGDSLSAETPESEEVQRLQGGEGRCRGDEGALRQGAGDTEQ